MNLTSVRGIASVALLTIALSGCSDDPTSPDVETFVATLSGSNQVPAINSAATGSATIVRNGGTVEYTILVTNVVGATAAHIHMGSAGFNGAVVVPLFADATGVDVPNGMLVTGTFVESDLVAGTGATIESLVAMMASGGAYVNVHTMANPTGEIRGQTSPQ
jgi:CHRD domain-containing protein